MKTVLYQIQTLLMLLSVTMPSISNGQTSNGQMNPARRTTSATTGKITCPYSGENAATEKASGILCLRGTVGMFYPMPEARLMMKDLVLGSELLKQVQKLQDARALDSEQIALLKDSVRLSKRLSEEYRHEALDYAKKLRSRDKWYKSPALWFVAGIGLGALSIAAGAIAFF